LIQNNRSTPSTSKSDYISFKKRMKNLKKEKKKIIKKK